MANLVFDSTTLSAHATSDGNTLTEISASVVQKKLWQDLFGDSIDSHWTTTGAIRGATENGTVTEASGDMVVSPISTSGYRQKNAFSPYVFNDGTFILDFSHSAPPTNDQYGGLYLYVDDTHWVSLYKIFSTNGAWNYIRAQYQNGGAVTTHATVTPITATDIKFQIVRATNTFTFYYDIGAGWVQLGGNLTQAIGANCSLIILGLSNAKTILITAHEVLITGSSYFWDTDPVVNYIAQDTGSPGATIQCGSATGTFDATTKIDIKFGTGAWQTDKTLAQIQALGDQATDDGTVTIRTTHKNTTSQSGFTSLTLPWAPAGYNASRGVLAGVNRGILSGVGVTR